VAGAQDIIQWMVCDPSLLPMHQPFGGDFASFAAKSKPAL
jgi:hypothetical protein